MSKKLKAALNINSALVNFNQDFKIQLDYDTNNFT